MKLSGIDWSALRWQDAHQIGDERKWPTEKFLHKLSPTDGIRWFPLCSGTAASTTQPKNANKSELKLDD